MSYPVQLVVECSPMLELALSMLKEKLAMIHVTWDLILLTVLVNTLEFAILVKNRLP